MDVKITLAQWSNSSAIVASLTLSNETEIKSTCFYSVVDHCCPKSVLVLWLTYHSSSTFKNGLRVPEWSDLCFPLEALFHALLVRTAIKSPVSSFPVAFPHGMSLPGSLYPSLPCHLLIEPQLWTRSGFLCCGFSYVLHMLYFYLPHISDVNFNFLADLNNQEWMNLLTHWFGSSQKHRSCFVHCIVSTLHSG